MNAEGMTMKEFADLIGNQIFAVAVGIFLLLRMEKVLGELRDIVRDTNQTLSFMIKYLVEAEERDLRESRK